MSNESLADLHTALIDAREGYETAIDDADDETVRSLFRDMHALHGKAHADIHAALLAGGQKADESGSFMATVHKTVISVRSAVVGLDEDALSSFASGEQRIVERYDDAIAEESDSSTAGMLEGHKAALVDMIGKMKRMHESDAPSAEAADS